MPSFSQYECPSLSPRQAALEDDVEVQRLYSKVDGETVVDEPSKLSSAGEAGPSSAGSTEPIRPRAGALPSGVGEETVQECSRTAEDLHRL